MEREKETNGKKRTVRDVFASYGKKTQIAFIIITMLLLALVLWGVIAAVCMALPVRHILISGEVVYSEAEVIAASEISETDRLQSVDTDEVKERIIKKLPYVKEAEIKRSFPATLEISLIPDIAYYYIEVGGEFFALSEELRVLERAVLRTVFAERGLICLALPRIESAIIGYTLTFAEKTEDNNDEYITEYLNALRILCDDGSVDGADLVSKFNVKLIFKEKYLVKMGDIHETETKIRVLEEVLRDDDINEWEELCATVDVSNPKKVSVKPDYDNSLVLVFKSEGE